MRLIHIKSISILSLGQYLIYEDQIDKINKSFWLKDNLQDTLNKTSSLLDVEDEQKALFNQLVEQKVADRIIWAITDTNDTAICSINESHGIRPLLELEESEVIALKLKAGDIVEYANKKFRLLTESLALCMDIYDTTVYDQYSGKFNTSVVKASLSKWLKRNEDTVMVFGHDY